MKFRLRAFGLHLLASAAALLLTIGTLYMGWYHWPGWYLADVTTVFEVMAGADLVLGPLLTFTVASPQKAKHVLARDIAVIGFVQICALVYGTIALWHGRPLYYAFSENCISIVQRYDIDPDELTLASRVNAPLIPHWYSLPRWIWAPLPQDASEHDRIVRSAILGGSDVISMPRYFQPWDRGIPALRKQLQTVAEIRFFTATEKRTLQERMKAAGYDADQPNGIAITGRGRPLLAVFDPVDAELKAIFRATK